MRDARGRFIPGQSGNPKGRPVGRSEYLVVLKKTLTLAKWKLIVIKAIEDATDGDRFARAFLADYVMGKPIQFEVVIEPEEGLDDALQQGLDRVYGSSPEDGLPEGPG